MEVSYTENAKKHLQYWKQSGNKQIQKKITELLESIIATPYEGIGKPEALKYEYSGYWSRRINEEHRMVYRLIDDNEIEVSSLRFHY